MSQGVNWCHGVPLAVPVSRGTRNMVASWNKALNAGDKRLQRGPASSFRGSSSSLGTHLGPSTGAL